MKRTAIAFLIVPLLLINFTAFSIAPDSFEQIKTLVGDWEGTFKWTGDRTGEGKIDATYYLTGRGSAIVENLIMGNQIMMTSVYHPDGISLRMTHFVRPATSRASLPLHPAILTKFHSKWWTSQTWLRRTPHI